MNITRNELRRLISESMLQPTFFLNMKARQELLPKIVADPNVHPKIKELLQSGEESQTNQGAELLKTMNPEYIEELESYESHQDSIEYHREFEEQRDNLFFIQVKSIVDKYKRDTGIPLQSDALTVENISKDTTAGSYTDRSSGRRVKRFTHKRLHGAAIYATDKTTLERIATELDAEKGMGGERLYHSVGGQGQPLLTYINDYYLTAFDSNLKRKNEMHKKGKYELKVFPATPDHRVYKQPTHRKLKLSMYETNLTRNQLRRLIETTIKPTIPNVPSEDALGKIDSFAREKKMQPDADSFAGALGYPEDRSYSEDLRTYDEANAPTLETVSVYRHPNIVINIPRELVDDVIDAHLAIAGQPGGQIFLGGASSSGAIFRQAAIRVFHYIEDETKRTAGEDKNVYEYGLSVRGYRADEYQAAMEAVGEHI